MILGPDQATCIRVSLKWQCPLRLRLALRQPRHHFSLPTSQRRPWGSGATIGSKAWGCQSYFSLWAGVSTACGAQGLFAQPVQGLWRHEAQFSNTGCTRLMVLLFPVFKTISYYDFRASSTCPVSITRFPRSHLKMSACLSIYL